MYVKWYWFTTFTLMYRNVIEDKSVHPAKSQYTNITMNCGRPAKSLMSEIVILSDDECMRRRYTFVLYDPIRIDIHYVFGKAAASSREEEEEKKSQRWIIQRRWVPNFVRTTTVHFHWFFCCVKNRVISYCWLYTLLVVICTRDYYRLYAILYNTLTYVLHCVVRQVCINSFVRK